MQIINTWIHYMRRRGDKKVWLETTWFVRLMAVAKQQRSIDKLNKLKNKIREFFLSKA